VFNKILIANRGEIACRVIKTAKTMGISTVAIFSEQDAMALHVAMADEAVCIGPAPASESYLNTDNIVAIAKQTGSDAVHPGYGFLSEKSEFAAAIESAGIIFIGPSKDAISAMGDKIRSKKIAEDAGVSTVPGYLGVVEGITEAIKIAEDIGYPLMIKASAGGGGKGMRIAHNSAELSEGFQLAANEALASFGDGRIFLEKYIEKPRHIEIQILGDKYGNVIHLGERECSIQRRHQKIIEEAPSAFLDSDTRGEMGAQAVALAKAVKYSSAGTVEFIVDEKSNFYFLEMNTRLQVEHPVTEFVTGIDLVEQMIRIASGEKISLGQEDVRCDGWAIEARVYAEDPSRNFLPSTGRLNQYKEPVTSDSIRIDSGVIEGSEISIFYDPLISKLIAFGSSREVALEKLKKALSVYLIRGIAHNIPFLTAVISNKRFAEADFSTDFLAEEFLEGFAPEKAIGSRMGIFIAAAAFVRAKIDSRVNPVASNSYIIQSADLESEKIPVEVEVSWDSCNAIVNVGGSFLPLESDWSPGSAILQANINGVDHNFVLKENEIGLSLTSGIYRADLIILTPSQSRLYGYMPANEEPDLTRYLLAPMPGLLVRLSVDVGDVVKDGDELAVVEAMKMENVLRSERDGTIAKVNFLPGDHLEVDQVILEYDE